MSYYKIAIFLEKTTSKISIIMPHITLNTVLLNGSLDGPRKVDMGFTQTCIMYVIPRECTSDISDEKLLHQHCFYILLGKDIDGSPKAYIGQTYDFTTRVRDHQAKKDFWDTALVFVSKTDEIFASEVAFLEYCGITAALAADNYNLDENKQTPKKPKISPNQESGMELFFRDIKLLTRFYNNCQLFEKAAPKVESKKKSTPVPILSDEYREYHFTVKKTGVFATLHYYPAQKKYIILSGSTISAINASSLLSSIASFRDSIFATTTKSMKLGDVYQLLEDIEVPGGSASAAANFCAGNSRNGKVEWIDDNGHTIGEFLNGKVL